MDWVIRSFAIVMGAWALLFATGCDESTRPSSSAPVSASPAPSAAPAATGVVGPSSAEPTKAKAANAGALAATQNVQALPADTKLVVGVTLHPYYSWTRAVVGDEKNVEVRPLLPGDVDAGNYQPRPEDIDKLKDLDALVINGLGHDDFIKGMLEASGNDDVVVIRPNDGTPIIENLRGGESNSHTFISFTNAIQQTYAIEKVLAQLKPDLAETFRRNASAYAKRLRTIKGDAAKRLANAKITRVVTVHDGYSYLLQELGIEVAGVVEPSHGLVPSAKELGEMVELLKKEDIEVVLSEESFPKNLLEVLERDGGANVTVISHIASGEYTDDKFEKEMEANAKALIEALDTAP